MFFRKLLKISILYIINLYYVLSATVEGFNEKKSILVKTVFGECEVVPCGLNSFCAMDLNGTCVKYNLTYSQCQCKKGYITLNEDLLYQCCYKQKSSFIAFMLEVFIGFGIGHFYRGNTLLATIKLVIYIIFLIMTILICIHKSKYKQKTLPLLIKFLRTSFFILCGCTCLTWQLVDSILFGFGIYTDNNGISLY